MSNRDKCNYRFKEIHDFTNNELELAYRTALNLFLSTKDLKRFSISFTTSDPGFILIVKERDIAFSCRLQSFPGCCGYLVMSSMSGIPLTTKLTPFLKGVFELARVLNYQTLFTSHVVGNSWFPLLKKVFEETHITGQNIRTGNELVYFVQPVLKMLPVEIHEIFEAPETESSVKKALGSSFKRLIYRTPTDRPVANETTELTD